MVITKKTGAGGMDLARRGRAVSAVFAALADPTRRAILRELARGPAGPTALAKKVGVSQPAASKHLRVLGDAGLVRMRVHGREHLCTVVGEPLDVAAGWLRDARAEWAGADSVVPTGSGIPVARRGVAGRGRGPAAS